MQYTKKINRPTIIYRNNPLENKDLNKNKQKNILDELVDNIAAQKQKIILQEIAKNQIEEEEENYDHINLTTLNNDDNINYDQNYELNEKKIEEQNQDDSDEEFFEEINQDETVDLNNKMQKAPIQTDNKKKFFELYKADDDLKDDNNLVGNFDSVYNTENLNINLNPSKNQFIRIYDDMMNDEENQNSEKLTEIRNKIFDFIKKNPISVDIGDMIIRLGNKHLELDPVDNKGATECFEVALKIYAQMNDNISNILNAAKISSISSPNKKKLESTNDIKSATNISALMNNSGMLNSSSAVNNNNLNPYKLRAVRIRQGETLKKIVDCNISDMDIDNAHKNIDLAARHYAYLFGDKSREVADCVFKKAYITQLEQKWKEAIEFYNYCLTIYKNVFRYYDTDCKKISHIEIGDCYFKLALIKEKQKNFHLSIEYYNMALEIYKNYFKGDNNDECALTLFNIGLLNEVQDIKDKALKFYEHVKEIYLKMKPESQDYIDILIKTSNLYIHFNKFEEASADLLEALTVTIKKSKCDNLAELLEMFLVEQGDEEVDVYAYNADLVEICFLLSKIYSIPEHKKFQEGFEILKISLVLMPPQTDFIDETFAVLKKLLENLNEENYNLEWEDDIAECISNFMIKVDIETEEKKLSFENENCYETEISENKANEEEKHTTKTAEVKDLKEPEEKKAEKVINSDSEDEENDVLSPKISLKNAFFLKQSEMLQTLAKNCTRIKLYRSSVELYLKCVVYLEYVEGDGPTKNKICDIMNQIALEYSNLTNVEAAIKFFEKTLNLRLKVNGPNDLKTAGAYNNLAVSYNRLGDNLKALEYWQLGMEIKKNNITESDDPRLGKDYYNFSLILLRMKELDKAIEYMLEALYIFDKRLGKNSQYSADACLLIGEIYHNINNYKDATPYCSRAMKFFTEKFGQEHPNTIKSQLLFAISLSLASKYDNAVSIFKPVIEAFLNKEDINKTSLFIQSLYEYAKCLEWNNKYEESLKYFEYFIESADDQWSEERLTKVSNKIAQLVIIIM